MVRYYVDITYTHTHAREKPIKTEHPLNSRIYYFLFALLCFTSHCDLCSGFWLCFLFPHHRHQHYHHQHFNRQRADFVYYRSIDRNATISNIRMCDKHSLSHWNKSEWVSEWERKRDHVKSMHIKWIEDLLNSCMQQQKSKIRNSFLFFLLEFALFFIESW